jgi:hypothetical protein
MTARTLAGKIMDEFGLTIFIGIVVLLVLGFILSRWLEKRRTDAWRRVAEMLGLPFIGVHNLLLNRCPGFKVFSQGENERFYNAIEGETDNIRITIGDYSYRKLTGGRTGNNTRARRRVQTVCVLESNSLDAPHCYLRPQRAVLDKLGAMFGGQDLDFSEDKAFSNAYVLQGDNETAIRELFDPQVRAWFADHRDERFQFEARGNLLVLYYGKKRDPEDARQCIQQALEVVKLLAGG